MIRIAVAAFALFATLAGFAHLFATGDWLYLLVALAALALGILAVQMWEVPFLARPAARRRLARGLGMPAVVRDRWTTTGGSGVDRYTNLHLKLAVHPDRGAPYLVELTRDLRSWEGKALAEGAKVVVVPQRPGRPKVAVAQRPGEEWQRRLEEWRPPKGTPATPEGGHPWLPGVMSFLAGLVAGIAAVVAIQPTASAETFVGAVYPSYNDFVFGERRGAVVETIAGEQPVIASITFDMDGTVTVTAPSTPGAVTLDEYRYESGDFDRVGPASPQPEDPAAARFELREVDLAAIGAYADEAVKLTGLDSPDTANVQVQRQEGSLRYSVFLDNGYYEGTVVFDPSGEVLEMAGGAPGSPASGD